MHGTTVKIMLFLVIKELSATLTSHMHQIKVWQPHNLFRTKL